MRVRHSERLKTRVHECSYVMGTLKIKSARARVPHGTLKIKTARARAPHGTPEIIDKLRAHGCVRDRGTP